MSNSSWGSSNSWGGPSGVAGVSSETSSVDGTSVDSWGSNIFVGVVYYRWSNDLLDDWLTLDGGWDWNVVWGIDMDWGWDLNNLGLVLEYFIGYVIGPLNWDWFVNNEGFLANTGDWGVVGNGSQEGSWDSNVDVSNDWFDDSGVVCSDVWPVSIFELLGYYWWWLVNRDGIWASNVLSGVWGWKTDGWCCSNWGSGKRGSGKRGSSEGSGCKASITTPTSQTSCWEGKLSWGRTGGGKHGEQYNHTIHCGDRVSPTTP
jgi:hypothetical protein